MSLLGTFHMSEGPLATLDLPSISLAAAAEDMAISIWPSVCYSTFLVILFIALLVVGTKESKRYRHRETNGWKSFRGTIVLLVVLVLLSVPYYSAMLQEFHDANRPEIEYYISSATVDEHSFYFGSLEVEDWEVVGFDGQALFVYADKEWGNETGTFWFYLRMANYEENDEDWKVTNITSIGDMSSVYDRGVSLTTRVEDERLACYYTYIFGPNPGLLTYKVTTSDLMEWSDPVLVDGQPEPEGGRGQLPYGFTDGRRYEIGHHELLRTSGSGNLLMIEYVEDQMCYDETEAVYFAHKAKGREWTKLVQFKNIDRVPRQMVEVAPDQFAIVYFEPMGGRHYHLRLAMLDVSDFSETTGPFHPV